MRNIKLIIEYDGTGFHGWQSQPHDRTVQDVIETAIFKLTGQQLRILGSGRTGRALALYRDYCKLPACVRQVASCGTVRYD